MTPQERHAYQARNNRALLVGVLIAIAIAAVSCLATAMDDPANAPAHSSGRSA